MPEGARERILERLRRIPGPAAGGDLDFGVMERKLHPPSERYPRLKRMMEAVHAEFLEATEGEWPKTVRAFVESQGLKGLAYGPATAAGAHLGQSWPQSGARLVPYDRPIEALKRELFEEIDAGFTTTLGGIAETGALILWPSPEEPRLLSLVPPIHIALLDTRLIYDSFWHVIRSEGWATRMPPNALLISGPSKTADIEQTLAYGVHGPKRLIVVALT
ncbi:MAG TPA: lactate utilization protein [Thermoanaerobaculia bacterium]|nr:lactate utilization protein [Thermoanaerobaculia bacterium]